MTNQGWSQDVEPDPEPAEIEGSVTPNGHLCSQALLGAVWNPMEPEWNPSSKPKPLCSGSVGFEKYPACGTRWNPTRNLLKFKEASHHMGTYGCRPGSNIYY